MRHRLDTNNESLESTRILSRVTEGLARRCHGNRCQANGNFMFLLTGEAQVLNPASVRKRRG